MRSIELKLSLLTFFLLLFLGTNAQQTVENSPKSEVSTVQNSAKEGTFQLVQTGKIKEVLNSEMLRTIESQRDAKEEVKYALSKNLTVIILPREVIEAPGFVPVKSLYREN